MDASFREMTWQSVDRIFADLHLTPGTPFPVAIMFRVRGEESLSAVRAELERAGLEVASVEKRRWPFGRRWEVFAKSSPQPIARTELEHWLDGLEATVSKYDAVVAGWVPVLPAA